MKNTIVGVDLAKDVIQVCVYTNKNVRSNIEMTPSDLIDFLANSKSLTIVFEACGTSNFWKQKAISLGHDARLISAKLVAAVRQNQKTDRNDALVNQLNSSNCNLLCGYENCVLNKKLQLVTN